jgi:hypothetical protein
MALSAAHPSAQTPAWQVDVGGVLAAEAWDFNEHKESLTGFVAGVERRMWGVLRLRVETPLVHVQQTGGDAWLRGVTVGPRVRWRRARIKPFVDLAVGMSDATRPVPLRGTAVNFLAQAGAGVQLPLNGRLSVDLAGRWVHISNNGREGRQRNPDIQALGAVIAIGWSY